MIHRKVSLRPDFHVLWDNASPNNTIPQPRNSKRESHFPVSIHHTPPIKIKQESIKDQWNLYNICILTYIMGGNSQNMEFEASSKKFGTRLPLQTRWTFFLVATTIEYKGRQQILWRIPRILRDRSYYIQSQLRLFVSQSNCILNEP